MAVTERKPMKNGEPNLRGRSRWLVRVETRDPITGRRKQLNVGTFQTKKAAERAEAEAITERERGTLLAPDTTTVSELLREYIRTEVPKTVRPENRQLYEVIVNRHLIPAFGEVRVRDLSVQHVERLLSELTEAGKSPSLVTKVRMRLSSALRMAMRYGIANRNVAEAAKPPKITTKPARVWTPDEVSRFLDTARGHRLWPLWLLMVETGARQSELLGLTWDDVDLNAATIRLGRQVVRLLKGVPIIKQGGKSKAAGRTVRITPGTVEELRAYRRVWLENRLANGSDWNSDGLVFTNADGGLVSANNLRRRDFDALTTEAAVPVIGMHEIRKTSVTLAIAAGASPKAVASRVGHADVRTTLDVYARLTASMEDEAVAVMEAIVTRKSTPAVRVTGTEGQ